MLVGVLAVVARLAKPPMNKKHFEKKWSEIVAEKASPMAVIKADSLVDEALRHAHIKGQTMGERLNNSKGLVRDINGTWSAHKLRNKLVHETTMVLSDAQANKALKEFKKALKDLGAL